MTRQYQSRKVGVAPLQLASGPLDRQVRQSDAARVPRSELAAYSELRAAVDDVAAREAWLASLGTGLLVAMARKRKYSAGLEKADGKRARLLEQVRRHLDERGARSTGGRRDGDDGRSHRS